MNKRMVWMLVITGVIFGGVFGFKWFGGKMMNQFFDHMPIPPSAISTASAQSQSWNTSLSGVGTVIASNGTQVTTESGGIVAALHFESGAEVKQGALLVSLSSANEQAQLQRLEAQASLTKTDLGRLTRLYKLEAISRSDVDKGESDYDAAKAAVDGQRALLAQKNIRAPFTGRLGIRQINVGQFLSPGTPIVSLQALNPIYVDFTLPEQNMSTVVVGQTVTATVDSQAGRNFTGKIAAIEPEVDSKTRNFKIRASFTNVDGALRPGLFARASVGLPDTRTVITIPRTAISYNPYGNSVYVVVKSDGKDGNKAGDLVVHRRFVKTGEDRGDLVVVTEGLKAGEQIATSGLLKLQNNTHVIINNSFQPGASSAPTPGES